jgi:hypothetical protein
MKVVRAISIRQPYAEQILRGTKRWEFRSTNTTVRERVWIYASARPADDEAAWRTVRKAPGELPTGMIVGSVVIDGVKKKGERDFAYRLVEPRRARPRRATNHPQPVFWRPRF